MGDVLRVEFRKFGKVVSEAEVRRDLVPLNFETIRKTGKIVTTVTNRDEYIVVNFPARLVNEGSLYTSFKAGDLLIAPAASSLVVVLKAFSESRWRMFKAGEVKSGLEALRSMKTGESITIAVTEVEQSV
ncbi:hypothetical protein IG193_04765 [Infirmifilum lucidum]|uniref:Uncharacterized protein n=1 Tax=Infirmifilum lucidum TaxID=2776706 RepID=A0A7L9FGN8_9CREN|nr:hypothetical protein [Infirmifilum lucidum]QOJ78104.1 hypothetical protein IG193_04765 [Infirmifilum lucidum]